MTTEDIVTFRNTDVPHTSFTSFREMRRKGELCDLRIVVEDNSFTVHRVILAGGIPYFRQLFTDTAAVANQEEVTLADLNPSAFESLINYAYSGTLDITAENVRPLYMAAHFLEIKAVCDECVVFLLKRIDASNVIEIHDFAGMYNINSLLDRTDRYICKNFEEFSKSEGFLNLPFVWIKDIISEDELNVSSEKVVIEAVLHWMKNANTAGQKRSMLSKLLKEVRMTQLPKEYLMNLASSEELIRNSVQSRDLIDRVKSYHLSKDKFRFSYLKTEPRKCKRVKYDMYGVRRHGASSITIHHCDVVNGTWRQLLDVKVLDDMTILHVTSVHEKIYVFLEKTSYTYDVDTYLWEALEHMHDKIEGSAIAPYESNIFFFGSGDADFRNKVRCFRTVPKKWQKEVRMKSGRDYAAAASLGDLIYITGGYNASRKRIGTVEKYSPSTGQWRDCASMLSPRTSHGITSMGGKLYICGGFDINGLSRSAEAYDPATNQWTSVAYMKIARGNFSLVAFNDEIFALGGKMGAYNFDFDVENYNPECDHWKTAFPVPVGFQGAVAIRSARNMK